MSQTEPEPVEEEPAYGDHATVLEVTDTGDLRCTVCDHVVMTLAPEVLFHNTDRPATP